MFENIDFEKIIKVKCSGKNGDREALPIIADNKKKLQLTYIEDKKAYHKNFTAEEFKDYLAVFLTEEKSAVCFVTAGKNYEFRRTKKGGILTNSYKNTLTEQDVKNSGEKQTCVDLNDKIFERIGLTVNGKVKSSETDKVKQIDNFCRQVLYIAKIINKKQIGITDFGCGKSYLTFAVKQTLEKSGYTSKIKGLDLKSDVVEKCNALVKEFNLKDIEFKTGDIAENSTTDDLVIWLHACDTATDYALSAAIKGGAKAILCVPCCQKELNASAKYSIAALDGFGIVKERMSSLFSDTIRALTLKKHGYDVSMIEYVNEGSLKNIMLRAVKADVTEAEKKDAQAQIDEINSFCGARITLQNICG